MDSGLHWMDIKILPRQGSKPNQITKELGPAIKKGAQTGGGKAIYVFRVVGENRIVAALDGGVTGALEAANEVAGEYIEVETVPCRPYESWADKVVGADKSLLQAVKPGDIGDEGRVIWMQASVDYKGMSQQSLLDMWKREVEFAFPKRVSGEFKLDLYKFLGRREIVAIFRVLDVETWDDGIWSLPLYVENGDQIERFTRSLDFI